jgi:hypothetical protein
MYLVTLVGCTENLLQKDELSRLFTRHDYYTLLFRILVTVLNTISYQDISDVSLTVLVLFNFLFTLFMVRNYYRFLPYNNFKILKLGGALQWGMGFITFVYFLRMLIYLVSHSKIPTSGIVYFSILFVVRFAVTLIDYKLKELISLNIQEETNHLKIIKVTQLMIRYITNSKNDVLYSVQEESDMENLITAGILSHHKAQCKTSNCFCKQKAQNLDDSFVLDYDTSKHYGLN